MKKLYQLLVRLRVALLLLVVLSMVPVAFALKGLRGNNAVETFLAENDPALTFYREVNEVFGGDRVVFLALETETGTVLQADRLAAVDSVSKELGKLSVVDSVTSLTTANFVLHVGDTLAPGKLSAQLPLDPSDKARLERRVRSSPLLGALVSEDLSSTVVVLELARHLDGDPGQQTAAVRTIREQVSKLDTGGMQTRFAGNPVLAEGVETFSNRDQRLFSLLMVALIALVALAVFRRLTAMLLPVVVLVVAVGWTMSLFVLDGNETNWVTSTIAPVLSLVSVTCSIHFLFRFRSELRAGVSRDKSLTQMMNSIVAPCFFTAVTTAVGFGSLAVSQVRPVSVFGIFAAMGVLLAFAATICLAPALLSLAARGRPWSSSGGSEWIVRVLTEVERVVQRRPVVVVAVSLLVAAGLASGVGRIDVETNVVKYFRSDTPLVMDALHIDKVHGGSAFLDIVIDSGSCDGAFDPTLLRGVSVLQERLKALEGVSRGVSLADLVCELHMVFARDEHAAVLPASTAAVQQLILTLATPEMLEPLVDNQGGRLRVRALVQTATLGAGESRRVLGEVRQATEGLFADDVTVRFTGYPVLFLNMDRYLVSSQVKSFAIVLVVLAWLLVILFRSARIGLAGMIPNIVPIAAMLGLMGWLSIPLDGFTVMIASIAIGIGVDDTIHFLHHLRRELAAGRPLNEAISSTLMSVGQPVVFSSAVLALGFWVFCLSDFTGTANFGLLTGATIIFALLADLFTLPALLLLTGVPRGWLPARPPADKPDGNNGGQDDWPPDPSLSGLQRGEGV